MLNVLKQFGEKDIDFLSGRFQNARMQLTAVYVVLLAIILFLSSGFIYSAFSSQLQRRFSRFQPRPHFVLPDGLVAPSVTDVQTDLIISLLFVNGFLLVAAGFSSYWLAGKTLRPIQAAYDRQRQFLSDASHELRTPIAILQMDLENQLASHSQKNTDKQIKSQLEEVDRMGKLVADLLTLSRLDEGSQKIENVASFDIRSIIEETVGRFQLIAKKHQVTLEIAQMPTTEIPVQVNKDMMIRALSNIVSNAIFYNKPNGTVNVRVGIENNCAQIQIADSGVGMSEEVIHKIFDRFYRTDKSRSRETGGSGLGLSIVRAIMNQLNGTVQINSDIDSGTTVVLQLPVVKAS